jgi:arylsulfatase A-like enzyme
VRAVALFAILTGAKLAAMARHGIPATPWSIVAFAWQDAVVAAVFGIVDRFLSERRHGRAAMGVLYCALAAYAAGNIPIGRALATPLTWPMLQATRGALSDSLLLHVTGLNMALVGTTLLAAAFLVRLPGRLPRRASGCAVAGVIALVVLAPFARSHVDAHGRDRNVLIAFVESAMPHVHAGDDDHNWRASPWTHGQPENLSYLRGAFRGRNVVLISLESTAAQYLAMYGGSGDVMPTLTALSQDALVFDRAYAAYPESIKGLFSVLCATFPAFDVEAGRLGQTACDALPSVLRKSGYATGLFHSGRFGYLGMDSVVANRGFDTLEDAGHIGGNRESSFGVDEPSTVNRMLAWIDAVPRDQPFLLMYLPIAGHHPYEVPSAGAFSNADDFGRYRNALRYGDASLGALRQGLRTRGHDRNTVWILFGDHGEAFGQHRGNYGHTFFVYDENVHVPLVISAPGVTTGQRHVTRAMSLVDLAPTILDLFGLDPPAIYQGRSALDESDRMALFFTDYSLPLAGLVDGDWKAVYDLDTGRTQLFDHRSDPAEVCDVSSRYPIRVKWYAETLQRWSAAQKHYLLASSAVSAVPVPSGREAARRRATPTSP